MRRMMMARGGSGGGGGVNRGAYDPTVTNYIATDIVSYRGQSYTCISAPGAGNVLDTGHALYTNLVGMWPMNEGSGGPVNLLDSAAGTLSGSGTIPSWGTKRNLQFHGASGASLNSYVLAYAAAAGSALAALQGGNMTIVARVTWDGSQPAGIAERNDANATDSGFIFSVDAVGRPAFLVERASSNLHKISSAAMTSSVPSVIAVTYDGSANVANVSLYVDGSATSGGTPGSGSGTQGTNDGSFPFRIGNAGFSSPPTIAGSWPGTIWSLMVWKGRLLSSSEIASAATLGVIRTPTNPTYWTRSAFVSGGEDAS